MYTKCQTYVNKSIPDRRTKQSKEMNFNHTLHSEGVHKNKQMTKNERKFDGEKKNCWATDGVVIIAWFFMQISQKAAKLP